MKSNFEPAMQGICLVHHTDAFPLDPGRCNEGDVALEIWLTYKEWRALTAHILRNAGPDDEPTFKDESIVFNLLGYDNDHDNPDYPMLSRFKSVVDDIVFERDEVETFRLECLKVVATTSDKIVLAALEKLVMVCHRAIDLELAIYMLAQ